MISKSVKITSVLLMSLIFLVGCSKGSYKTETVENICGESPGLTQKELEGEYLKEEDKNDLDQISLTPGSVDLQDAYYYYSDEGKLNCGEDKRK